MANTKKISYAYTAAQSHEAEVVQDGTPVKVMDDTDGVFRETPADARKPVLEHLVANGFAYDIHGRYVFSEARAVWPDGDYQILIYPFGTDDPITSLSFTCTNDALVR
jgi:hypothetical protein